jgi:hypothetical protein
MPIYGLSIMQPAAAFTMAILLFVYARTSIRAAKSNAQRHRDADTGGEGLSLLAEHRRRYGTAEKVEGTGGGIVRELGREVLRSGGSLMNSNDNNGNSSNGNSSNNNDNDSNKVVGGKGKGKEKGMGGKAKSESESEERLKAWMKQSRRGEGGGGG